MLKSFQGSIEPAELAALKPIETPMSLAAKLKLFFIAQKVKQRKSDHKNPFIFVLVVIDR